MKIEKVRFKNRVFYLLLISCLILLSAWNIYALTIGDLKAIIPIIIQGVLLFLILTENKHAKLGIKIWAIILILSNGISFLAKLLKIFLGDEVVFLDLLNKTVFIMVGVSTYFFNKKYVEISTISNKKIF